MRPTPLFVLALVGISPIAEARADPTGSRPWPSAGRCLVQTYARGPCVRVTAADAAAIRTAVLRTLESPAGRRRRAWRAARELARRPVTEHMIGGFQVEAYRSVGHDGDVVRLRAAGKVEHGVESGYRIVVGRTRVGGWTVLDVDAYREGLPQPDG